MYKVGEKVLVKQVNDAPSLYIGRIVTIYNVCNDYKDAVYRIREDNRLFRWYDCNFEQIPAKSDNPLPYLKDGVFVENKYGDIGVVVGDKIIYSGIDSGFDRISEYNEWENGYIEKIYSCNGGFRTVCKEGLIWLYKEKESIPEVTLEEVYEKFGYKVKVVIDPTF